MKENETVVYSGKIGEVIHATQPDGRVFERYRRPPGTRLIITAADGKILMTREHRGETGNVDLRLPGGKVRDSLAEYHELLKNGEDMVEAARKAAAKEALEETGLIVHNLELVTIAGAGATVEWDLYYFKTSDYKANPGGQQLEHGEDIEVTWLSADDIGAAIGRGEMQEWRSVGVLTSLIASVFIA